MRVERQLLRNGTYGPTKTPAGVREIELTPELVAMFKRIIENALAKGQAGPEAPVFTTKDGKVLGHRKVSREFHQIRQDAGLDITWHDMRDHYASKLIYEGFTAPEVARRMGHEDASITMKVYAKEFNKQATSKKVREVMAK